RLQSGAIGSTSTTRARSSFKRHGCETSRTHVIRYRRPRSWLRHALRTLHGLHSGCGPRYTNSWPTCACLSPTSVIWTTTRASLRPKARRSLRVSVPRGHRRPRDSDVGTLKVDATMAQDGRVDQEVPGMMSCIVFGTAPGAA